MNILKLEISDHRDLVNPHQCAMEKLRRDFESGYAASLDPTKKITAKMKKEAEHMPTQDLLKKYANFSMAKYCDVRVNPRQLITILKGIPKRRD